MNLSNYSYFCVQCGLPLQRGKPPSANKCPEYDTIHSDGKVPVMFEFWGKRSNPSLPSLPGDLWPGVVEPDRVLSKGQLELKCVLMRN